MPRTDDWGGSELLARSQTPDGALTLRVHRTVENGEPLVSMGFEEGAWHFHPTADEAIQIFDAVDLAFELDGSSNDIAHQFRLWSGPVSFEDLVDGKAPYVSLDHLWNWRT
ncbi:hypothetical protein [Devosia sp. CN2-171]|uniref:hypothetical protein n=1 Tax=Devosia sp. CN2-171 TaxID=3400909 RepID=UPI003BF92264